MNRAVGNEMIGKAGAFAFAVGAVGEEVHQISPNVTTQLMTVGAIGGIISADRERMPVVRLLLQAGVALTTSVVGAKLWADGARHGNPDEVRLGEVLTGASMAEIVSDLAEIGGRFGARFDRKSDATLGR